MIWDFSNENLSYLIQVIIQPSMLTNSKVKHQFSWTELCRQFVHVSFFSAIFERLRNILHESTIDKRVQYMIEVMFAIRKDGFKDHPVIPEGLDLVDEDDQFTHMLPLDDEYNTEDILSKMRLSHFTFDYIN